MDGAGNLGTAAEPEEVSGPMISISDSQPKASYGRFERRDVFGILLMGGVVVWTFLVAERAGNPWPMAQMALVVAAAYGLSRWAGRAKPVLVPGLVVVVALVLGMLSFIGVLAGGADAMPLGYVNARSAFWVMSAAATVMLAMFAPTERTRIAGLALAGAFAAFPLLNGSEAASLVALLLLPPAAVISLGGWRPRLAVWLGAATVLASLAATLFVAAAPQEALVVRRATDVLGERRVSLWRDGLDLVLRNPLTGVGPGQFAEERSTARNDPDARWAHHGFLQQGAETGLVGFVLFILLFLWGFWRLSSVGSGVAVIGAFALVALGVLACSDYVLHFPLLTATTAALVGTAVGSGGSPATRDQRSLEHDRARLRGERFEGMVDAGLSRSPLQPIFQWRAERKLSVLAYHGIDQPERFEQHLAFLRENAHPVSLAEAIGAIKGRRGLPPRAVLITFDDGDRSVLEAGLPALQTADIPGVVFVVSGFLDTEQPFWWEEVEWLVRAGARLPEQNGKGPSLAIQALKGVSDERRRRLVEDLRRQRPDMMVRKPQLLRADLATLESAGIAIGNHSLTHPCLRRCTDARVQQEVVEAHGILESVLADPPAAFAYPDGQWDARASRALRGLGYDAAFLFDHRASSIPVKDPLRVSRLRVNAGTSMDRFRTILSGLHPALHRLRGGR
jgi:peptidoglycan/xylan/chitin deacetylase (PgdA/CDA1 family)/O-antigen ligase